MGFLPCDVNPAKFGIGTLKSMEQPTPPSEIADHAPKPRRRWLDWDRGAVRQVTLWPEPQESGQSPSDMAGKVVRFQLTVAPSRLETRVAYIPESLDWR